MKKSLLTAIATLFLCGSLFAQSNGKWASHWPEFDYHQFTGNHYATFAFVQIDGIFVEDGDIDARENYEFASFVEGECRGAGYYFLTEDEGYDPEWDPHPVVQVQVYMYSGAGDVGKVVNFKMYDHGNDIEYDVCTTNIVIHTGDPEHNEYMWNPEEAVVFNFTSPSTDFTLNIPAWTTNPPGGYRLISSPIGEVSASNVENLMTNNYDLYWFNQVGDNPGNEPNNEWINMHDGGTLEVGKGYLYANSENVTLTFTGTPYTDNGEIELVYSEENQCEDMWGWNLIGNPLGEEATLMGADPETGDFTVPRDFYVMNNDGTELTAGDGNIDVIQGIFVKAASDGETVQFVPAEPENDGKLFINVLKDRGNTIDRAIVRLNGNSTLPKFMLNPNNTKIYIEQDGDDYAVVSSTANEMPVSFKASRNGTYTLNVAVENAEMGYLHLIDHIAGTDTDLLTNPSYTFEANTNDYASRFTLVMVTSVGLEEHFAFYNGHNWSISNNGEALLQVVDVMGRVLNSKEISGDVEININQPAGVYMFRLINGNDVKVQKVIIK